MKNKIKIDRISNDLVKELGLTEDMLNDPKIQANIAKINGYLEEYRNAYFKHSDLSYVMYEKDENEKIISILNYRDVIICSITKTNDCVYFKYDRPSRVYLNEPETLEFNYRMLLSGNSVVYEKGWYNNENHYYIHIHKSLEDEKEKKESEVTCYIPYAEIIDGKPYLKLSIDYDGKNSYTLNLTRSITDDYRFAYEPVSFKITKEDYQTLDDLLEVYKDQDEFGDILAYLKDTLAEVIQKYGKNPECQNYLNLLNEHSLTLNK